MRGFSKFAATFHFRAQVFPKEQHEKLSELLIQTLELWQRALDLVGVQLLIEDEKGKPRVLKTWARALRTLVDEPGAPVRHCEALEQLESSQPTRDINLSAQFEVQIDKYPNSDEAVSTILHHAMKMGEAALAVIGADVSFSYQGETYSLDQFALLVQSGALYEEPPEA